VRAIVSVQERKLREVLEGMSAGTSQARTILPGFTFSAREVADKAGLASNRV